MTEAEMEPIVRALARVLCFVECGDGDVAHPDLTFHQDKAQRMLQVGIAVPSYEIVAAVIQQISEAQRVLGRPVAWDEDIVGILAGERHLFLVKDEDPKPQQQP